jgi:hypothetical protein
MQGVLANPHPSIRAPLRSALLRLRPDVRPKGRHVEGMLIYCFTDEQMFGVG